MYPDHGAADGGLAGAGFAHQAKGLAAINIEGDLVHGAQLFAAGTEVHGHIFELKNLLAHPRAPPLLAIIARMFSGGSILGARGSSSQVRALWVGLTSKSGGFFTKSISSA